MRTGATEVPHTIGDIFRSKVKSAPFWLIESCKEDCMLQPLFSQPLLSVSSAPGFTVGTKDTV